MFCSLSCLLGGRHIRSEAAEPLRSSAGPLKYVEGISIEYKILVDAGSQLQAVIPKDRRTAFSTSASRTQIRSFWLSKPSSCPIPAVAVAAAGHVDLFMLSIASLAGPEFRFVLKPLSRTAIGRTGRVVILPTPQAAWA
jgi:hypothetical protein